MKADTVMVQAVDLREVMALARHLPRPCHIGLQVKDELLYFHAYCPDRGGFVKVLAGCDSGTPDYITQEVKMEDFKSLPKKMPLNFTFKFTDIEMDGRLLHTTVWFFPPPVGVPVSKVNPLTSASLGEAIQQTEFVAYSDDVPRRYRMDALALTTVNGVTKLVATDNHRMVVATCEKAPSCGLTDHPPILLNAKIMSVLAKVLSSNGSPENIELGIGDDEAIISAGSLVFWFNTTGKFPDWQGVLDSIDESSVFLCYSARMRELLARRVGDDYFFLDIKKKTLHIVGSRERVVGERIGGAEGEFRMKFLRKHWVDMLKFSPEELLVLPGVGMGAVCCQLPGVQHVIMSWSLTEAEKVLDL